MTDVDDQFDAEADATIIECLNLAEPRSFFLYAGAGSGKDAVVDYYRRKTIDGEHGRATDPDRKKNWRHHYTNAACGEIKQRLEFDPRVEVMTIHAFSWSLIRDSTQTFVSGSRRTSKRRSLSSRSSTRKGRPNTKAGIERLRSMESKRRRLARLDSIVQFIYSPTESDNRARDSPEPLGGHCHDRRTLNTANLA